MLFTLSLSPPDREKILHYSEQKYARNIPLSRQNLAFNTWISLRDLLVDCNARYLSRGKCVRRFEAVCKHLDRYESEHANQRSHVQP